MEIKGFNWSGVACVAAALALAGCSNPLPCAILHRPVNGCPKGYAEKTDFFIEPDGSKQTACVADNDTPNNGYIDVLKPGESVTILVP